MKEKIKKLIEKGVDIKNPDTLEIGDEVNSDNISKNITIHTGCKIFGQKTSIMDGTTIGYEAPVTIENCQIGPDVQLKGGFFKEAVFLKKSSMGYGAFVRPGTILEEEANCAHTVALKQTILFPFVTLGSLINFCDCLMSGGTSRKNHSEVGSSYIHFNFTPNQDKATPSIMGDVPRGVMLDNNPIFLGGQGGIAGPCIINFGTVIAAGSIYRKDQLKENMLVIEGGQRGKMPFNQGIYQSISRIIKNNIFYITNLCALRQWYLFIRSMFIGKDFSIKLYGGLTNNIDDAITERITRLEDFKNKLKISIDYYTKKGNNSDYFLVKQKHFYDNFDHIKSTLNDEINYTGDIPLRDLLLNKIDIEKNNHDNDYIKTIQSLDKETKINGTKWLNGIVEEISNKIICQLPDF